MFAFLKALGTAAMRECQQGSVRPTCGRGQPGGVGSRCDHGRVWTYSLFDYDPERDGDEEAWAAKLAVEGWRTWTPGPGPWIVLEGRTVRRWSLRRYTPDSSGR